ncbi:hypothetical protein [Aliterella atlantica]|nr:hypothetical protein [Aliterella atlantica]
MNPFATQLGNTVIKFCDLSAQLGHPNTETKRSPALKLLYA